MGTTTTPKGPKGIGCGINERIGGVRVTGVPNVPHAAIIAAPNAKKNGSGIGIGSSPPTKIPLKELSTSAFPPPPGIKYVMFCAYFHHALNHA